MSFACHSRAIWMSLVCARMPFVCDSYVTRMYSFLIRMSLVYTRMSSVCHSYVLVCHLYVILRTGMSSVCPSYVLICHPYVRRMHSYVIHMSLLCSFTMNPWLLVNVTLSLYKYVIVISQLLISLICYHESLYYLISWGFPKLSMRF